MTSTCRRLSAIAGIGIAVLVSAAVYADADCGMVDGLVSICGRSAPEDIVTAPQGGVLLFGQMGEPGGLYALDTRDDQVRSLYPLADSKISAEAGWGEAQCERPPDWLSAHGIDLSKRADGRWQLLVVNHQERESVEFFEWRGEHKEAFELIWRGCVLAPPQGNFNDVAALPDGGFIVTHMADKDSEVSSLLLALAGFNSGYVYRWDAANGFRAVPGTQSRYPNGIILGPDGRSFFLNAYFGNSVTHHDLDSGRVLGKAQVLRPDNSSWSASGKLLVASHRGSIWGILNSVRQPVNEVSLLPFAVVEVDPQTMTTNDLLEREGPPMGAGTVAVEVGAWYYIGSYLGDRLVKVPAR